MKNEVVSEIPRILEGCVDTRWDKTIYNHYENPIDFMEDVIGSTTGTSAEYIKQGIKAYEQIQNKDETYDTLYADVAKKVKDKLITRGFTTKMLYQTVEFTTENTGMLSKQRAMLGRRDCYFTDGTVTDGNLFHDIYINLSYSCNIPDSVIVKNSYAVYALTKELSRLLPIRVIVVNHVGTDIPTCYSYVLKKFGVPIKPKEFLFFLSDSKRTFGWATYDILCPNHSCSTVGQPENTVPISDFNLDIEIDKIFHKVQARVPHLLKE